MAVLPTPGSPIRTGLFLVRRLSTWMTRRISSSRPMTGSILPSAARAVRSWPYFSSAANFSSGFWSVTRWLPRTSFRTVEQLFAADAEPVVHRQQEVLDREVVVLEVLAVLRRPSVTLVSSRPIRGSSPPWAWGSLSTAARARSRTMPGDWPSLARTGATTVPSWLVIADQQVVGGQLGVRLRLGLIDGRRERLLGLDRPGLRVERHVDRLPASHASLTHT